MKAKKHGKLQKTEGKQLLMLKNVLSTKEMQKDPDKRGDDFILRILYEAAFDSVVSFQDSSHISWFLQFYIQF